MSDHLKNFGEKFIKSGPSSRGIADTTPVAQEQEESPKAEEMIDALYYVLMERLDKIDAQLQTIIESCQNPKSHS